jgi:hypothetical protein
MTHIPYYYIIGWTNLNKWYVGCRFAIGCSPDDFWVKYFTSSSYVSEFRTINGEPDVRWVFPVKTPREAIDNEYRIMNEFHNFLNDQRWLNKNVGGIMVKDDDVKDRISRSLTGRKLSDETRRKMSQASKGKPKSDEHRAKLAELNRNKVSDQSYKDKLSLANYKKWSDPDTRNNMMANRYNGKTYEVNGDQLNVNEISEKYNIKIGTLYYRIKNNKPLV